jgi:hypothetical protein
MNIKGYRMRAGSCPIARYLNACGFPIVTVCTSAKRYQDGSKDSEAEESVYLPQGVHEWIMKFDNGHYPEFRQ